MIICFLCNEPVTSSKICFKERTYHLECFKCSNCKNILINAIDSENSLLLCKTCSSETSYVCFKCKELLQKGEKYKTIKNNIFYHSKCFICAGSCNKPIQNRFFQKNQNEQDYFCQECFDLIADLCNKCHKKFESGVSRISLKSNIFFHKECFLCCDCNQAINSAYFLTKSGDYLCKTCNDLNAKHCTKCNQVFEPGEDYKKIGENILFHTNCFTCAGLCKKPIRSLFCEEMPGVYTCKECKEIHSKPILKNNEENDLIFISDSEIDFKEEKLSIKNENKSISPKENAVINVFKNEISLEIIKILESLNYGDFLDKEWMKNFIQDFTENGISALSEFGEMFGTKDTMLLTNLIKVNEKIRKYFENKIPKVAIRQALKELKNLLIEICYDDSMNLTNEFLSEFQISGFEAVEKFKPKFGEKDTRALKKLILKNQLLNEYNNSLKEKNMQEKVLSVLLLGATGAGKSSLINLLYLWSQGVSHLEKVNRTLIPTKFLSGLTNTETSDLTQQDQSQTQKSFVHRFKLKTDNISYHLSIMDTPGLGDVRGVNQDDANTQNILDTVSKTAELNCIVLMINGAEARVSDRVEYIIQRLSGILPNVVRDNLIVLLSNSRLTPNLDVKKYINLPAERIFFIDNLIFSLNLKSQSAASLREINFEFKNLKEKLGNILEMASNLKFVSTENFRKLKQKRELFKIEIDQIRRILENKFKEKSQCDELLKEIIQAENQKSELELHKFKRVTETYWEEVNTDPIYNTRCITCRSNCHENCSLDETSTQDENLFKDCLAMIDDYCKICSHKFDQHVHLRTKYVKITRNKLALDENVTRNLETKNDLIVKKKSIVESIEKKRVKLELEIQNIKANVVRLLEDLKEICSDFNYSKELLLTKSLLEARIDYLQAQFSKTKNPTDFEEIQSAIKSKLIISQIVRIVLEKTEDKTNIISTLTENDSIEKNELDIESDDEEDDNDDDDDEATGEAIHYF